MRLRRHVLCALPVVALAFACGTDGTAVPGGGVGGTDAGDAGVVGPSDGAVSDVVPPGPGVYVREGQLFIDGTPTFLFGGELQYFRVRDAAFDAQRTQALWRESVQKMKDAHMNLVTTYFAWDYHAPSQGTWDFAGARDADAFLKIVCDAGMKVIAKPGPLITGEWPKGFGSFGAVPLWWKQAHPASLVKKSDGSTFTFSPTGDSTQSQPSYLDRDYLAAAGEWLDKIVPTIKKYVDSRCVVGVQVDNETNLYWSDHYGTVDYNPAALSHFHIFIASRWGSIGKLNAAYGKSYARFDDVPAPTRLPGSGNDNVAARDWYDAGQGYALDYLRTVRSMLEGRGLREPMVLFMTNDSPFGLPLRNILVHDPRIKNQVGLTGLDLYPKSFPTNGEVSDNPHQVDYFTKLYAQGNLLYTKDTGGKFAFGAELQGGFYNFVGGITATVRPEATDQLLTKAVGHGLKGGSFYIVRGGLNLDGSSYDFQAAIGLDGSLRARYDVLRTWGAFLEKWGGALESSDEVEDAVAVVQDGGYAVPQAGTNDDHQYMHYAENPGLFGWLAGAGYNPRVLDARVAANFSGSKVVFFLAPQLVDDGTAQKLKAFADAGGVVVQLLDKGSRNFEEVSSGAVQGLASLFDADADGMWAWPGIGWRSGTANQKIASAQGEVRTYWYETFWAPRAASVDRLVVERTAPFGSDGKPIAFVTRKSGRAPVALVGGHVASVFNHSDYYGTDAAELGRKLELARSLVSLGGVTPAVHATGLREEAWARHARGADAPLFVFVVSDHDTGAVHVAFDDLGRLALDPQRTYDVKDELRGQPFGKRTGASLRATGLDVPLPRHGTAVVVIK